ncbi:regulatory YrvL family protein [Virgibacillus sp. NKC19-16]|uniref:regulatory YrvL family protein n=1 Tax=Virgibacillus salidurans TaxID=2831673 RepID=UPI001F321D27|nr:regulatory YrvL family protein [Virgibacillus sp. NKC19-16]UJL46245.1 regulatory YrvL family protein [Virgibacillus sp. NKC19-16]
MPEHKNNSFRDMNKKEKAATVAGIALLIIFVVGFVLGIYFFGITGIFMLLGVEYESIWSLIVFVVSYVILGVIVELFSKPIFKLLVKNIKGKIEILWTRLSIEGATNWMVLFTVDEFMQSITLSLETEIIAALIIAVIEMVFDRDKEWHNRN